MTGKSAMSVLGGASMVICCGGGGVGKTTTSAAVAAAAARQGRRAVVVTIDPARRLADALGLEGGLASRPEKVALPESVPGELWAMMLDARATFDSIIERHARTETQARRILSNRFYANISSALSGTQEYMAAEVLHDLHADERFDLVVVDTPPTRHALDVLDAPATLARFLDHRLYRFLTAPTRGSLRVLNLAAQPVLRTIGKIVGSDVLADVIAFFQSFDGMDEGFRTRALAVSSLLHSPDTRYVLVTSPRSDTVADAHHFVARLAERGVSISALVVNRVQPRFGTVTSADAARQASTAREAGDPGLASHWDGLAEYARLAEQEDATLAPLLQAVGGAPCVRVALRETDVHDLEAVLAIAAEL